MLTYIEAFNSSTNDHGLCFLSLFPEDNVFNIVFSRNENELDGLHVMNSTHWLVMIRLLISKKTWLSVLSTLDIHVENIFSMHVLDC